MMETLSPSPVSPANVINETVNVVNNRHWQNIFISFFTWLTFLWGQSQHQTTFYLLLLTQSICQGYGWNKTFVKGQHFCQGKWKISGLFINLKHFSKDFNGRPLKEMTRGNKVNIAAGELFLLWTLDGIIVITWDYRSHGKS